ncbi:non-specific lipid-transfer protein 1-like [Gastrolobium bilobum]|uniref:non-specific lipid-transfer protein 1-like n=1 Tax=Gastrolobium bilobum TaxID=150636 RepID=UPI002AB2E852|nr:non-specific lipid-transfer protein 1-like [Gastrolobium bilobum]
MAKSLFVKLLCMAIVCLVLGASSPKAEAITCGQVVNNLTPCITYILNGGIVPARCCNGVRSLLSQARTTPDRQAVCNCIKNTVSGMHYSNSNLNLAASLPRKCGVNIPYQISPSTDCSRVR